MTKFPNPFNDPYRTAPWTITQLAVNLQEDLQSCSSMEERNNCQAACDTAIRELYREIKNQGRQLTPGEESILKSKRII